jgi:hypothetical protein
MTTIQTKENKKLILANEFFSMVKTKKEKNNDEFVSWVSRWIRTLKLELNYDFYIVLSDEAAEDLAKYETFQDREAKKILNEIIN